DDTTLLPETVLGSTTPEKRMNSAPLSSDTCFSPATTRLPFDNTSMTVTVSVLTKLLLELTAPLSSNLDEVEALASRRLVTPPKMPNRLGASAASEPVLLPELPAALPAELRSLTTMVMVSPIRRARRSSNTGR